jgi:hypothetical protein
MTTRPVRLVIRNFGIAPRLYFQSVGLQKAGSFGHTGSFKIKCSSERVPKRSHLVYAVQIMTEIHEGQCAQHTSDRPSVACSPDIQMGFKFISHYRGWTEVVAA